MARPVIADLASAPARRLSPVVLGGLLALALLPYLLLAHYNFPSIHDDYHNAVSLREDGRWGYVVKLYQTWTGRYTEVILKALLHPLSYQKAALLAQVQPVVVILLLIGGAYLFVRTLLAGVRRRVVLGAAILLFLLYVGEMVNAGSVLYWFGGYTAYTAGSIASFAVFAGLVGIRRYRAQPGWQAAHWLLAAVGAAVAIGAYDVCLMATAWLTFTVAAYTLVRRRPEWPWYAALLVVVLGFAYFSATAPGNAARAASAGQSVAGLRHPVRLVIGLVKSIYFALGQVLTWQNSVLLLAGSLLLAPWLARHSAVQFSVVRLSPLWLLLWLLVSVGVMVFPAMLIYQNIQYNTWHCVHFYFLMGWLLVLAAAYQHLLARYPALEALASAPFRLVCQLVLAILYFGSTASNTHQGYLDLAFRASDFAARSRQREQAIQQHRQQRSGQPFLLKPLYSADEPYKVPVVLYTVDFNDPDRDYFGQYYYADSVRAEP